MLRNGGSFVLAATWSPVCWAELNRIGLQLQEGTRAPFRRAVRVYHDVAQFWSSMLPGDMRRLYEQSCVSREQVK